VYSKVAFSKSGADRADATLKAMILVVVDRRLKHGQSSFGDARMAGVGCALHALAQVLPGAARIHRTGAEIA